MKKKIISNKKGFIIVGDVHEISLRENLQFSNVNEN